MDEKGNQQGSNASAERVYDLAPAPAPGEPAIVINGVPDIIASDGTGALHNPSRTAEEKQPPLGLGEWLEGRKVRKWFRESYYSGTIKQFDKQSGWFRVLYEDGDSEDLDWPELEEVLLPLDVTIPLKSLAQKIVRKGKKNAHKAGKSVAQAQNTPAKRKATKGK